MKVLAVDTAGPVAGVALWVDGTVHERVERVTRGAETRLVPWAEALCAEAGVGMGELDGIAIAVGPGAFTGLRVGLATGLGWATALGLPVWPDSSLVTRAARVGGDAPVWVALDARKGRLYAAVVAAGEVVQGPGDVPPEEALGWMDGPFVATGEGALVVREALEARGGRIVADADHPAVDALARRGALAFARGEGVAANEVLPTYLRDADAKRPGAR